MKNKSGGWIIAIVLGAALFMLVKNSGNIEGLKHADFLSCIGFTQTTGFGGGATRGAGNGGR